MAAWDVHRARLFGRCEPRTGIAAFDRLVDDVMTHEPYRSARRVFWVMDNGSAHRGAKGDARLQARWPTLVPVHTPPACQLVEPDRDLLFDRATQGPDPNDFATLAVLEHYLLAFQHRYQAIATPFRWTFTRADLHQLLAKLATSAERARPAA